MAHARRNTGFNQAERFRHVVPVVVQWPLHRVGNHDTGREVDHRIDVVFGDRGLDQGPVPNVALDQRNIGRHKEAMSGRKIVENDCSDTCATQGPYSMAADVARATCNQDTHDRLPPWDRFSGARSLQSNAVADC